MTFEGLARRCNMEEWKDACFGMRETERWQALLAKRSENGGWAGWEDERRAQGGRG
jgi:hypothetical protein